MDTQISAVAMRLAALNRLARKEKHIGGIIRYWNTDDAACADFYRLPHLVVLKRKTFRVNL